MHQQHMQYGDKQQLEQGKSSASGLIGSALMGAAVGAAVMLASDPVKRKTIADKAKETKERVGRAVEAIKSKKDQIVEDTQTALKNDDINDELI